MLTSRRDRGAPRAQTVPQPAERASAAPPAAGDATRSGRRALGRALGRLAPIATVALATVLAFRKLDNFDTWWHLAAGRWIVEHRSIPATDTLSHTVRDHAWINLQWAYDVALYALHVAGGPALLVGAATLAFSLAAWLALRLVRRHIGPAGAAIVGLAVVLVIQDRFDVRPEMASFPLFAGLLAVLESGRRREGRGLWLLVPLMLVWVNTHSLFVIGDFAIVCALFGALAARIPWVPAPVREASTWDAVAAGKLVVWGPLSLGAGIVNPFGLRGLLFPAKLLSRIDRSSPAFQSIAEFRSPFAADAGGVSMAIYKFVLVAGLIAVLGALVLGVRRKRDVTRAEDGSLDLGGVALFSGLAVLSFLARRNVALFAIGATPFIARSLATVASALPSAVRGWVRKSAPVAAAVVVCGTLGIGWLVVSGAFYRWDNQPREFGAGVLEGSFPVRAAAFAREARLPPKLYNDVAAGGYLTWDDPIGDGVFIDGRLEVYDTEFFSDYVAAMYDPARWDADADRFGVQTVILFHRWENRRLLVERLVRGGAWSLVYADEVAAVFVRSRGNEQAIARAARLSGRWNTLTRAWLDRPVPKGRFPAGRIEGTRAFARLLATIGDAEGAADVFSRLVALGVPRAEEIAVRRNLATFFLGAARVERARDELRRILALAPGDPEASELLRRGGAAESPQQATP